MEDNNSKKRFLKLVSINVQEKNGDIWFSASNRNGVYKINSKTYEVMQKIRFKNENISDYMLFHDAVITESKIFFSPHRAKKIAVYDINREEMIYLDLKPVPKKYNSIYSPEQKFACVFQDEKYVYLLGYTYPAIVKIHVDTLKVTYINGWIESVYSEISRGDTRGYFTMGKVKNGRKMILPMGCVCGLLELNLDTEETRLIHLDISLDGIGGISKDENGKVWIVGRGKEVNKVVIWDIQLDTFTELDIPVEKNSIVPFYEPLCYKNAVFLFPVYSEHAYKISIINNKAHVQTIFDSVIRTRNKMSSIPMCVFAPRIIDSKIKFITGWDRKWHEYNLENDEMNSFFVIDNDNIKECDTEALYINFNKGIIQEGDYNLSDYRTFLFRNNEKKFCSKDSVIGMNIYHQLSKN